MKGKKEMFRLRMWENRRCFVRFFDYALRALLRMTDIHWHERMMHGKFFILHSSFIFFVIAYDK